MKLQKSLKIALNIILHSQLRSWLTIVGIVIGVGAIISIISIGNGFQKDIQTQLGGLGADLMTVSPGFERASGGGGGFLRGGGGQQRTTGSNQRQTVIQPFTNKEVQAIKSIPEIVSINAIISGRTGVYYLGETANLSIQGVDTTVWKTMTTSSLKSGRFISSGDTNAITLGSTIANGVFKNNITTNRAIEINGKLFKVVGILQESGGFGQDDRTIFMSISSAKEILGKTNNNFDSIIVKVKNPDNIDQIQTDIETKLMIVRHRTKDTKDFSILSLKATQERVSSILSGITLFLGVIAAVSLIVGAVGITNTMFTSVLEKTKEIGIMKALGAKNKDIMIIFLFNSGLVGFVGGAIGCLFGIAIALLIPKLGISLVGGGRTLSTSISPELILVTLIFSVVIGMISGAIPAYRASKLKPVEALRAE